MNNSRNKNAEQQPQNLHQHSLFELTPLAHKSVQASFTGQDLSSDGGALLLREVDQQIGLTAALADCISDTRDTRYVSHQLQQILAQRIYQIGCGYEDGNDCGQLRGDPVFKMCSGRLPYSDPDLASQPTMSRFENGVSRTDLYRISECFVDRFMDSYASEPEVVILDCDDTNSNTYGQQQPSLFNAFYRKYCYMPVHIYEGLSGKLITTILKPGRRSKAGDVFALLRRVIEKLRRQWTDTVIVVRGDSHFCSPQLMEWAKTLPNVHFLTGLAGNSRLHELAGVTIRSAEKACLRTGRPVKRYHSFYYKADSWENFQRVIAKVEVGQRGTNVRYIVTDMRAYRASHLYEKGYCKRGAAELRIKDHKRYLRSDRTSCCRFEANQLRLFLHSAAYVLIHSLQKQLLGGTGFATATFKTIQLKVLKVAAWVKELKTKIKIEFPHTYPFIGAYNKSLSILQQLRL